MVVSVTGKFEDSIVPVVGGSVPESVGGEVRARVPDPAGDPFGVSLEACFRVRLVFLVRPDYGVDAFSASLIRGFIRELKTSVDQAQSEPFLEIPFQIEQSMTHEQIDKFRFELGSQVRGIINRLRNGPDALTVKRVELQVLMGNIWTVLEY